MAQQVKFIKVQTYDKYVSAVKTYPSAIVFGEFADAAAIADASASASAGVNSLINLPVKCEFPVGTKLIYANGIQYDVTNLSNFSAIDSSLDELYELVEGLNSGLGNDFVDLSTYVHRTVDVSISNISTRLADASTRLDNVSTRLNDLSTYVHRTVDVSISDISTRLSGALKNASLYAEAGTDSSVKITLVTNTVANTSLSTDFKVNGSEYVNVQHVNNAVSVSLQNTTNSSNDIIANSEKLVKAGDLYNYISTEISNLEGALQFKGGIANGASLSALTPAKGDVYVATGDFEVGEENVKSGDLLIYGENEWVIVERNLDGAVESASTLAVNHVVVGDGNHTVKTTDFVLPSVDNSTGIKDANPNSNVLTTQYAVKDYVDEKLAAEVAGVKVSVSTGTKDYVRVSVNETGRDISVGVITAKLGDYADLTFDETKGTWKAADGSVHPDGLATAADVARAIQENEKVVATALNTVKDKVGLENDLSIDWDGKYEDGTSIVEAIKNINVGADISTAIAGLDSSVAAAAGKVLTKVVQENGKLTAKEEATLKINNVQFTNSSAGITAEITANDIKLTTGSGATDTVKNAIDDLRDGKIGEIFTGNATITVAADSSTKELTSRFTQHTINSSYNFSGNVSRDASIFTELLVTKTNTAATALATDAYVLEKIETAVSGALVWEEF